MNNIHKCLILSSLLFFVVSCGDSPKEVTLDSISLSGNYQKSFWQNETFNYDNLVVTAHYSDQSTKLVSPTNVSSIDTSKVGEKEVEVTYLDINTKYKIDVKAYATSLELSGDYQTTFVKDEPFNYDGLVVTICYSDNSSKNVTDYEVDYLPENITSSVGTKTITVSYDYSRFIVSKTYDIEVVNPAPSEKILSSIAISNNVTEFTVGDEFKKPTVTAYFTNGDSEDVTNSCSFTGYDMSTSGDQSVTVSYTYQNVTKTTSYSITVSEPEPIEPEIDDPFNGYMYFASNMYRLDILISDKTKHYLNPGIRDKDNKEVDVSDFPFTFEFNDSLVDVSKYGGISSKKTKTGSCVVTCIYTVDPTIKAYCTVNVVDKLPTKEKGWVRVDDYDSLSDKDILVIASPSQGVVASLDTSNSKLHPVNATFSNNHKTITSMDDGVAEFYLGFEEKGMTLEAQTGEYLICTHQGKIKLDSGRSTNKYWDIHSNVDPETGTGSIEDGAVIENNVESLGYMMFNITLRYFTTYVENSITQYMALPFIYRLQELN